MSSESNFPIEPTIIYGVIHPHGVVGVPSEEKVWTLKFSFETWRGEDGIIYSHELALSREFTFGQLVRYLKQLRLKSYQIVAVRVVFTGSSTAELLEVLDQTADQDEVLAQRSAELQIPKLFEHERFGIFTLDRRKDWYVTNIMWAGRRIRLMLSANDTNLEAALRVAVELWENQPMWDQRIREYVVQELLDTHNMVWLHEDEQKLTPDDFKSRFWLVSIIVCPNGDFEFRHDSGELFEYFGQAIFVNGNLHQGLKRARI